MRYLVNFGIGLLFGLGLIVSGMIDPAKVLNFLDFAGTWDPSLAFVMGGAVIVTFLGYRFVLRRPAPIADVRFHLPAKTDIDAHILTGPVIFGLGWGLSGYCPGPAIAALGLGNSGTLVFLITMLLGFWGARTFGRIRSQANG